jgi:hypothetical protein
MPNLGEQVFELYNSHKAIDPMKVTFFSMTRSSNDSYHYIQPLFCPEFYRVVDQISENSSALTS